MATKNIAYALTKPRELTPMEREMPSAGPGEVVIRVFYVGVCGSDAHFFETGFRGETPIPMPFVLGHECSGIIVALGWFFAEVHRFSGAFNIPAPRRLFPARGGPGRAAERWC